MAWVPSGSTMEVRKVLRIARDLQVVGNGCRWGRPHHPPPLTMKSIAPWMRPQDLVAPDPARGFLQKLLVRQWIHSALLMAALLWMSSTLDPASARAEVSVSVDPTAQVPAAPACPEVPILSLSLACSVTTLLSAQATVT